MLRRRGVPGTLYLGMTKNPKGELEAHAWLRSGSAVLTGGGSSNQYTVLAAFAVRRVNL